MVTGRFGTKADVFFTISALDSLLDLAESVCDGARLDAEIVGTIADDDAGRYYTALDAGSDGCMPIGSCITLPDGGTVPGEDEIKRFSERFGSGVLMVVDQYSCEFAIHLVDGMGIRTASMIVLE